MKYDITVIVPVYNAESTLAGSLGNLLNQTKKEIEVILVNDASTDGSLRILSDARTVFGERVRVIDMPKNGGPGVARNAALDVAEGEYIGFMDSDDLIDPTMYEKLYNAAKAADADIADCAYLRDSTGEALIHFSPECAGELDAKKRSILLSCGGYNCMKIFRKRLFDEHNIRFRPVYILEDMDFLAKALIYAKKVTAVNEVLYRYRDAGEGSLTKRGELRETVSVQLQAMEAVHAVAFESEIYEEIKEAVDYMLLCLYKNILLKIISYNAISDYGARKSLLDEALAKRQSLVAGNPLKNAFVTEKFDPDEMGLLEIAESDPAKILNIK